MDRISGRRWKIQKNVSDEINYTVWSTIIQSDANNGEINFRKKSKIFQDHIEIFAI